MRQLGQAAVGAVAVSCSRTDFGTGVRGFFGKPCLGVPAQGFSSSAVPVLRDVPVLGKTLIQHDPLIYLGCPLARFLWFLLYRHRTQSALKVRAVGESPSGAEMMGVHVLAVR